MVYEIVWKFSLYSLFLCSSFDIFIVYNFYFRQFKRHSDIDNEDSHKPKKARTDNKGMFGI